MLEIYKETCSQIVSIDINSSTVTKVFFYIFFFMSKMCIIKLSMLEKFLDICYYKGRNFRSLHFSGQDYFDFEVNDGGRITIITEIC